MTAEEKKRLIAKLEQRYFQKYGRKFQISTKEALPRYPLGLRSRAFQVHRMQEMRLCLCEGKQSIPVQTSAPVDQGPQAEEGKSDQSRKLRNITIILNWFRRKGLSIFPSSASSVRIRPV